MILCCGEALIDMLPRKMEEGGEGFLPVPGGAVFNTAIALGRLGEDAGFFSSLSTDMFGDQLLNYLHESLMKILPCVILKSLNCLTYPKQYQHFTSVLSVLFQSLAVMLMKH
jgi:hypothetical protein